MTSLADARKKFSAAKNKNVSGTGRKRNDLNPSKEIGKQIYNNLPSDAQKLLVHPGICIAGGFVRDFINGAKPKDVDFFMIAPGQNHEKMDAIFAVNLKGRARTESDVAITYIDVNKTSKLPIQLIKKVYSNIEQLFIKFDFICCKLAITMERMGDIHFHHHPNAFEDAKYKILQYTGNDNPGSSICRLVDLCSRGYTITNDETMKVLNNFASKSKKEYS